MKYQSHIQLWTSCLLTFALTATLGVVAGGNGKGKGGGSDASVPCVTFDGGSDSLQSDGQGNYCHDPRSKLTVAFSNDGHLHLDTNESNKPGAGRSVRLDFGMPITILDAEGNGFTFQTTDDLDAQNIPHDINLWVGAFQDDFNMLTMQLGDVHTAVNLTFNLVVRFPGQKHETPIFGKLAPAILANDRQCEISDPVQVICTAVDASGEPIEWRVETQDPDNLACISQQPFGHVLEDLTVGLLSLSFGFTLSR